MTTLRASNVRVYFPALDGVRFLAFLLVLFSHERPVVGLFWPGTSIDHVIGAICQFGWIGVDIFLVLSAHLLTTLLLKENDITGTIGIGRFYARRALRIWPLYYPFLLIALFVIIPLQGVASGQIINHQLFPFAVFLGNYSYWYYVKYLDNSFSHLWTVCLEEQFYIVLPVAIYFARKSSWRAIVSILVVLELLALACRAYALVNNTPYPFIWSITPCRLDAVILGIVTALIGRSGRPLPGNLLILAAVGFFALVATNGVIGTTINSTWQITAADAAAACLILGALNTRFGTVVFANTPARYLGRISYGLYVYHEICLQFSWWFIDRWLPGNTPETWLLSLSITILCDIGLSIASYVFWERRFILFKNRLESIQSRPA